MAASVWPTVAAERRALANDLGAIDATAWQTPSLCEKWSVHDVLGHMAAAAMMTPPRFVTKISKARFSFDRMARAEIDRVTAGGPAETLAVFTRLIPSRAHPPGPQAVWLGETIVHGEDIRRPLGLRHTYPEDALRRIADFYRGSNALIGGKRRAAGLYLRATDCDWQAGAGPEVAGPLVSLVLAITGRRAALSDLHGAGVEVLRSRP
jgi:uncharacterized protein (TIGR03083 family)